MVTATRRARQFGRWPFGRNPASFHSSRPECGRMPPSPQDAANASAQPGSHEALLIRQHAADAGLEAARFRDLMLDRGDGEGRLVWQPIRR
jgi:hypothetical protein